MAKIERKYMAHFLNANIGQDAGAAQYERLGQDLEEYSAELNAQVDTTNNILGQKSIKISSYDKSGSVEPYYADKDSPLFNALQAIIDGDLLLDSLKTDIVEVHLWEEASSDAFPAVKEECYIEIVSYGGDTTGYQIPFNVHYTGKKTKGTFDLETLAFTEGTSGGGGGGG